MRKISLILAVIMALTLFPGLSLAETNVFVTIGFMPAKVEQAELIVRGTAPRGKVVAISVNDELVARVIAGPSMDTYRYTVKLEPGDNRIVAAVEGTQVSAEKEIYYSAVTFADMEKHWAKKDAETLATLGVVNGVGNGEFGPDLNLTRAQFAKMVVLGLGLEVPAQPVLTFADADTVADWARPYVAKAMEYGLITGLPDNTFRPNDQISRIQVAVIAARALKQKKAEPKGKARGFKDQDKIPAWAAGDVELVSKAGLLGEFWGEEFQAERAATRAEAAAVVLRLRKVK